jgi:hypothetical protein
VRDIESDIGSARSCPGPVTGDVDAGPASGSDPKRDFKMQPDAPTGGEDAPSRELTVRECDGYPKSGQVVQQVAERSRRSCHLDKCLLRIGQSGVGTVGFVPVEWSGSNVPLRSCGVAKSMSLHLGPQPFRVDAFLQNRDP